jgi:hypothetical protein
MKAAEENADEIKSALQGAIWFLLPLVWEEELGPEEHPLWPE